MNEKITENKYVLSIKSFFSNDKASKIIFVVGVVGIVLIFLSTVINTNKKNIAINSTSIGNRNIEYVNDMQSQLTKVVNSITRANNAQVVLTLENGYQYVYANQNNETNNTTNDSTSNEVQGANNYTNNQQYVILNSPGGGQGALLVTELPPSIKGVVIVCENGDQASVQTKVINAVATALGIPNNEVCVEGK